MEIPNFYLEPANFEVDFEDLRCVRKLVFVVEQQIPLEVEFDELDRHCHHVIARDVLCRPIGTGRLSPEGKIGRMAVLHEWRRQGVGESLLRTLIGVCSVNQPTKFS
jgi:predicted GNAT family N-acyltransferase